MNADERRSKARNFALLAERANQGALSEDERADYEALINTADLIAILKLKVRRSLNQKIHP